MTTIYELEKMDLKDFELIDWEPSELIQEALMVNKEIERVPPLDRFDIGDYISHDGDIVINSRVDKEFAQNEDRFNSIKDISMNFIDKIIDDEIKKKIVFYKKILKEKDIDIDNLPIFPMDKWIKVKNYGVEDLLIKEFPRGAIDEKFDNKTKLKIASKIYLSLGQLNQNSSMIFILNDEYKEYFFIQGLKKLISLENEAPDEKNNLPFEEKLLEYWKINDVKAFERLKKHVIVNVLKNDIYFNGSANSYINSDLQKDVKIIYNEFLTIISQKPLIFLDNNIFNKNNKFDYKQFRDNKNPYDQVKDILENFINYIVENKDKIKKNEMKILLKTFTKSLLKLHSMFLSNSEESKNKIESLESFAFIQLELKIEGVENTFMKKKTLKF
jgi:hypothetical protein